MHTFVSADFCPLIKLWKCLYFFFVDLLVILSLHFYFLLPLYLYLLNQMLAGRSGRHRLYLFALLFTNLFNLQSAVCCVSIHTTVIIPLCIFFPGKTALKKLCAFWSKRVNILTHLTNFLAEPLSLFTISINQNF